MNYSLHATTTPGIMFDVFNALVIIGYTFGGNSVALEIQETIP